MQFCYRCTDRSGADTRVKLLKPLQNSPKGFTGLKAHRLASLDGMGLFLECTDNSYVRRLDLPHDVRSECLVHVLCAAPAVSLPQADCIFWYGGHAVDSCNVCKTVCTTLCYCKDLVKLHLKI